MMLKQRVTGQIKELEVYRDWKPDDTDHFKIIGDRRVMAMIMHALCPKIKRAFTLYRKQNPGHDLTPRNIADLMLGGEFGTDEQSDATRIYQKIIDATDLPDIANINDNWG